MMYFRSILLSVLFLMSLVATAVGDIKIDYDFFNSEFHVSWDKVVDNYVIEISNVSYGECSGLILSNTITLDVPNYTDQETIIIEDMPTGKYAISVKNQALTTTYYTKQVYVDLGAENSRVRWCAVPESGDQVIWYQIYSKRSIDEEYTEDDMLNVGGGVTYDLSYLEPLAKIYMVITATDGIEESEHSNELILFIAIPPKLNNVHIEF